jgi:hypothetical protein
MSGPHFYETRMGQKFIESTMPEIARQLGRIADALEALVSRQQPVRSEGASVPKAPQDR